MADRFASIDEDIVNLRAAVGDVSKMVADLRAIVQSGGSDQSKLEQIDVALDDITDSLKNVLVAPADGASEGGKLV